MRKVIMIGQEPKEESKGVEFTHVLTNNGWSGITSEPNEFEKVVYLGKCLVDGDMFASYFHTGAITIRKGNLNNGTY